MIQSFEFCACFVLRISDLAVGVLPPLIYPPEHRHHLRPLEGIMGTDIPGGIVATEDAVIGGCLDHLRKPVSWRVIFEGRCKTKRLLPKRAPDECRSFSSADRIPGANLASFVMLPARRSLGGGGSRAIPIPFHPSLARRLLEVRKKPVPRLHIGEARLLWCFRENASIELNNELHEFRSQCWIIAAKVVLLRIKVLKLQELPYGSLIPRSGRNIAKGKAALRRSGQGEEKEYGTEKKSS